jgi:hypothetical protein
LVCGNVGDNNVNSWVADKSGTYNIETIVDENSLIPENNENNNSKTVTLKVYNAPPINLALNKNVIVSSVESANYIGKNAVDGNYATRWSSQFSDPQTFTVDLGQLKHFNQIRISWETAYGKDYFIEVSENGSTWNKIIEQTNGFGGIEKWTTDANARYIRLTGTKRGTEWGYSIYEFEVFNLDTLSSSNDDKENLPLQFSLYQNYPNPFNPSTTISYQLPKNGFVTLKIYDVLGREVSTLVNEYKSAGNYKLNFDASNLSSGVYIYTIRSADNVLSKKMILLR